MSFAARFPRQRRHSYRATADLRVEGAGGGRVVLREHGHGVSAEVSSGGGRACRPRLHARGRVIRAASVALGGCAPGGGGACGNAPSNACLRVTGTGDEECGAIGRLADASGIRRSGRQQNRASTRGKPRSKGSGVKLPTVLTWYD